MSAFERVFRGLLLPVSALFGRVARLRADLYAKGRLKQRSLCGVVVSVGNLTVGGTGKTPMVIWLAEHFLAQGKRVAILSRGYRGKDGTSDEIEVMKQHLNGRVAFGIGKNRFKSGKRFDAQGIDVFLLDDGFQHLRLARDLDIVLVDGSKPLEGERFLPSGNLRESASALKRADIVVITRDSGSENIAAQQSRSYAVFHACNRLLGFRRLEPGGQDRHLREIGSGPFFAFCGIGNPEGFFSDLRRWRLALAGTRAFRDHYRYTQGDVQRLEESATKAGAPALITTQKDAWNLRGLHFPRVPVYLCVIRLEPDPESEFIAAIDRRLAQAASSGGRKA